MIVDVILALTARGHQVALHAPEPWERPQFADLPPVLSFDRSGAWLPDSIDDHLRLPCAVIKTSWAARRLARVSPAYDVVFCDVVPHVITDLKSRTRAPVVYYGHFPDARLTPPRESALYRAYRRRLDRREEQGLAAADRFIVNSQFTAAAFRETFPAIADRRIDVIHPSVTLGDVDPAAVEAIDEEFDAHDIFLLVPGRIDPRKNLPLAVYALAALRNRLAPGVFARVQLVIAGHYDERWPEVRAVRDKLAALARELDLDSQVHLVLSPGDEVYSALRRRSAVVLFTAEAEHLGIVPLEAMAAGKPVVAANRGGPVETVVDGETGFLREPTPSAFADAVGTLLSNAEQSRTMGEAGRSRVAHAFSRERFGEKIEAVLYEVTGTSGLGTKD